MLFSSPVELSACCDALKEKCSLPFSAERIGVGPRNARHSTAQLLDTIDPPSLVLAVGGATWLLPGKIPAVSIWAREIKRIGQVTIRPEINLSSQSLQQFAMYSARLVTVSRPVVNRESGADIANEVEAEMADMESHSILSECVRREVSCAAIRAVVNRAGENLSERYREATVSAMNLLGQSLVAILRWHDAKEMRRLR